MRRQISLFHSRLQQAMPLLLLGCRPLFAPCSKTSPEGVLRVRKVHVAANELGAALAQLRQAVQPHMQC